jgi:hypothetical protein
MFILLALATVKAGSAPDAVELELKKKCAIEVPRDANMSYAGDLWRVLYDERLPPDKIQCIESWAKNWPKIGGILAYGRGKFAIPELYRRN